MSFLSAEQMPLVPAEVENAVPGLDGAVCRSGTDESAEVDASEVEAARRVSIGVLVGGANVSGEDVAGL